MAKKKKNALGSSYGYVKPTKEYIELIEKSTPKERKVFFKLQEKQKQREISAKFKAPSISEEIYKLKLKEAKRVATLRAKQQIILSKQPLQVFGQIGLQEQQARLRQRKFSAMAQRAEQIEVEAVSFNEVPLLKNMEKERTKKTMVSDRFLINSEKWATDMMPD